MSVSNAGTRQWNRKNRGQPVWHCERENGWPGLAKAPSGGSTWRAAVGCELPVCRLKISPVLLQPAHPKPSRLGRHVNCGPRLQHCSWSGKSCWATAKTQAMHAKLALLSRPRWKDGWRACLKKPHENRGTHFAKHQPRSPAILGYMRRAESHLLHLELGCRRLPPAGPKLAALCGKPAVRPVLAGQEPASQCTLSLLISGLGKSNSHSS